MAQKFTWETQKRARSFACWVLFCGTTSMTWCRHSWQFQYVAIDLLAAHIMLTLHKVRQADLPAAYTASSSAAPCSANSVLFLPTRAMKVGGCFSAGHITCCFNLAPSFSNNRTVSVCLPSTASFKGFASSKSVPRDTNRIICK